MDDLLIQGDSIDVLNGMPDFKADLAIIDPPYFKVANESWDYQWRTEHDYREWSAKWLSAVTNKMRVGATMYLFGYFRSLACIAQLFDVYGLELRQQIVIDKGMRAVAGRATKRYKMFPNVTETVLMLVKDNKRWFRSYVNNRRSILKRLGVTAKTVNEALGVKSNGGGMWSIYTGNNVCAQFPTKEHYNIIRDRFLPDLPEYNDVAQTFYPQMGLTDVWTDIDFYAEKHLHPTQKPLKLITRLVAASSNENDMVIDPFSGVGTTAVCCKQLNRRYLCIEKEEKYHRIAEQRVKNVWEDF